jgi:hypothetical protein
MYSITHSWNLLNILDRFSIGFILFFGPFLVYHKQFENIEKNLYTRVAEVYLTTKYSIERAINFFNKKSIFGKSNQL